MAAVEVITSVERRRRWSRSEKLRIVAETATPDRTVSQVARAHGIAPGQLFTWRRQLLAAALADGAGEGGFVPVRVAEASASMPCSTAALPSSAARIEIRLASGVVISVDNDVEVEPLRRVLTALVGR
jgi:transposase